VGLRCFFESEELGLGLEHFSKFSAKNPHLRVAAER
jgi:hypothetical protein